MAPSSRTAAMASWGNAVQRFFRSRRSCAIAPTSRPSTTRQAAGSCARADRPSTEGIERRVPSLVAGTGVRGPTGHDASIWRAVQVHERGVAMSRLCGEGLEPVPGLGGLAAIHLLARNAVVENAEPADLVDRVPVVEQGLRYRRPPI